MGSCVTGSSVDFVVGSASVVEFVGWSVCCSTGFFVLFMVVLLVLLCFGLFVVPSLVFHT